MPERFEAKRDVPRGRRSTHEPDAPCPPFEVPEAAADFEVVVAEELCSNGGVVDPVGDAYQREGREPDRSFYGKVQAELL